MKADVLNYRMTDLDGVGIYVGTYAKYNNGNIYGMWIDLNKVGDADEFFEVCTKLHSDEDDPEFMMQDFQGFPKFLYDESMNKEDVQKILDWISLKKSDQEILEDYVDYKGELDDVYDTLREAKDRFIGTNLDEVVHNCVVNGILSNIPDQKTRDIVETYFKYDEYEREIMNDIIIGEIHGNIFSY